MNQRMFTIRLSFLAFALIFSIGLFSQDKDFQKIKTTLAAQQIAWNSGDIESFMEYYQKSDKLLFSGASGITYGWKETLDRYKKGYPDQATMGKLIFEVKHLEKLSKKTAMMIGSWNLERASDMPGGHFMLIWKKKRGKWKIVADHTSSRCD